MRFTVLSHAGLLVEHRGVRVVCDPWLIGSCYWRSWWNFPEPPPELIERLEPQFIYLTHLHWDHFHGPSLRKLFDPKTRIIVPKIPSRRMVEDLRWLGFHEIIEVPHGTRLRLADDFELRSYQFGFGVDSGVVLSGGGHTLFNCNDCKLFGLPLRQVLSHHPRIDFLLRSHSSASPVPLCIENHEKLLPQVNDILDSADQFARCALHTGARYAIPFASNHCFLHPDTRRFNITATSPEQARSRYAKLAAEVGADTECVVMPPGSGWSDEGGFEILPFDFSQRERYVAEILERKRETLVAHAEIEALSVADFAAFRAYFRSFLSSVPWLVRRFRLRPVLFRAHDAHGAHLWLADPSTRDARILSEAPPGIIVIDVHASILNDCAKLKMFSVWTASKRLRIHLPEAEALAQANLWFTVLDLYETDLLPLRKNLSLRSLAVRLRRWREPVELANLLLRRLFLRQRLSIQRIYPLRLAPAPPDGTSSA